MGLAIDIRDFGAIPNDTSAGAMAANSLAFRLVQAQMQHVVGGIDYSWGGRVFVPPGVFYLDDSIHIVRAVELFGSGVRGESVLVLPPHASLIVEVEATADDGGSGSDCIIRDLQLWSAEQWDFSKEPYVDDPVTFAGFSTGTPGIKLNAKAILQRLLIRGFTGTAIEIIADMGYAKPTNANNWQIQGGMILHCGGHGVHTAGGDANGGLCVGLYIAGVGGNGIFESSFGGGTYIGCYVEEAKGRGFHNAQGATPREINTGNQATFIGCCAEVEIANPTRLVGGGAVFLGGATYFSDDTKGFISLGDLNVRPFEMPNIANPAIKFLLGYVDSSNALYGWQADAEGGNFWLFRWLEDLKVWSTEMGNAFPSEIKVSYQTATGHGRGPGLQGFPALLLGPPDKATKITNTASLGAAAPFGDGWQHGDIVYNSQPAPGEAIGWVYVATVADPAQRWKKFGVIEE